jgi:glycerophosphoryl diester phosphodiesterase
MIELALEYKADEIALHYSLTTARVTEKAKQAGLDVVVWTVDDPRFLKTDQARQIKALITNDPALMISHITPTDN